MSKHFDVTVIAHSGMRALFTHQGVIKANISLQTALSVLKLHNRHFSCCNRQDVPQTCDVGGKIGDHNKSDSVHNTYKHHSVIK